MAVIFTFNEFLLENLQRQSEYINRLIDEHGPFTFEHDRRNKHLHDTHWSDEEQKQVPLPIEKKYSIGTFYTVHDMADFDPDKHKLSNLPWMVRQYEKGHFKHEDLHRIGHQLSTFHSIKHTLPKDERDINRYTLNPNKEPKKLNLHDVIRKKQEHDKLYPDGPHFEHPHAKEVEGDYDRTKLKVFELRTHESARGFRKSCGWPDNSDGWCTGWKKSEHYDEIVKEGPLYGVESLEKHPEGHHEWAKYQFHFPTDQFMDKDDVEASPEQLVKRNPELRKVKWNFESDEGRDAFIYHKMPFLDDVGRKKQVEEDFKLNKKTNIEHHLRHYLRQYPDLIETKDIENALKKLEPNTSTRWILLKHPKATQKHIDDEWEFNKKFHEETGWGSHNLLKLSEITKNPEHLHHFYNISGDERAYGARHYAGIRLMKEFGQLPRMNDIEKYKKPDLENAAHAHYVWAQESERHKDKMFKEYHMKMHDHYKKLADEK